jgi:hypothetical protein
MESQKRAAPPINRNQIGWKRRPNGDNQGAKPIGNRPSSANDTPCPKCQRPHNGPCRAGTNMCYRCGQASHFAQDCPKAKGGAASLQTRNNHRPLTQARVYALTPGEAETENGVVTVLYPYLMARQLFYSTLVLFIHSYQLSML